MRQNPEFYTRIVDEYGELAAGYLLGLQEASKLIVDQPWLEEPESIARSIESFLAAPD